MSRMSTEEKKPDRHRKKAIQVRLHESIRKQLKLLAEANATTVTEEIAAAIRQRLKEHDLWPPPNQSAQRGDS